MKGDTFLFLVVDGTVKISGGDQDLRTSTFMIFFEENQKCLRRTARAD